MRRLTRLAVATAVLAAVTVPAQAAVEQSPLPFFLAPLFQSLQPQPAAAPAYRYEQRQSAYAPADEAYPSEQPSVRRTTRDSIAYNGPYAPGTIVINTTERRLYLVQPGNRAIRYAVGVGREGFQWAGAQKITNKQEWPGWTPPPEMLKRRPDLPRHMEGGLQNPLGARAMYLGGTLYRIHGSNEPETIGHAVSSGCIRMLNEDVVDLYERVRVGTKVVVLR